MYPVLKIIVELNLLLLKLLIPNMYTQLMADINTDNRGCIQMADINTDNLGFKSNQYCANKS